ncbi:MAG: GNAT family N-acetyltransferase [Flavobacteriales bacterium]|nr:GNAT family N-acetyltransferase [Flavobacteriales bacterium]
MLRIVEADTPELLSLASDLLRDFPPHQRRRYADHLHIVERYFDEAAYAHELADLHAHYGPPQGCVLLALEDKETVGVVCLRKLDGEACEMKRLYVPGSQRGKGIGKALVTAFINAARERSFRIMRLDTGFFMTEALGLYERFGFRRIQAYHAAEPVLAAALVFMEREVDPVGPPSRGEEFAG